MLFNGLSLAASEVPSFDQFETVSIADDTPVENSLGDDIYKTQCNEVKKFLVQDKFEVQCNRSYHHYNSESWKTRYRSGQKGRVRIGNFNILHPGNTRTAFKDLEIVAKILNEYDVVSALELLPVIGRDAINNKSVAEFINQQDEKGNEASKYYALYRAPGYYKILEELRKIDQSWALILSPVGDAAKSVNVQELAGFYYRSSKVKPIRNDHCHDYFNQVGVFSFACFPELGKKFMGKDVRNVFSRRPFLSSFQSGKFDFTLVTSHIVFNSPTDLEDMKRILNPSFGVDHYLDVSETGFTQETYARFAESKIILDIISKLKKIYDEKDVIYLGDMNLEANNSFWSKLLSDYEGFSLLGDFSTTLAKSRYDARGYETLGLASNYDHFIINEKYTANECATDEEFLVDHQNFLKGKIFNLINKEYLIRGDLRKSLVFKPDHYDYQMIKNGDLKIDKKSAQLEKELSSLMTVKRGEIVPDNYRVEKRIENFKRRVFYDQLKNDTFYRVFREVVSDHLPISIDCFTTKKDDD